jgi:hypothetical protein
VDARRRAAETDAARAALDGGPTERDRLLCEKARRYHAAVRRLRGRAAARVAALTGAPGAPGERRARRRICDR